MKHRVFICLMFIIVSGCSQRSVITDQRQKWVELEARMYDLPIPDPIIIDYDYIDKKATDYDVVAFYSFLTISDLASWYKEQMDICGWICSVSSTDNEILIRAKKPKKWCSISLRSSTKHYKQGSFVVIFTGLK